MFHWIPSAVVLLVALPALAGQPAAIPPAGRQRAEKSFEAYAAEWMARVQGLEERHRTRPDVKVGATAPLFTYRGYGDEYSVELRPTGHPGSPFVGLLRYTEHVYSCASMDANQCNIASSVPVTEIFRYSEGRWSY